MGCSVFETPGINLPYPRSIPFQIHATPPSTAPLSTQTSSGSSTLSKKAASSPTTSLQENLSDHSAHYLTGPQTKAQFLGVSHPQVRAQLLGSGRTRGSRRRGQQHSAAEETQPCWARAGARMRSRAASADRNVGFRISITA